jgi:hypothetical protein
MNGIRSSTCGTPVDTTKVAWRLPSTITALIRLLYFTQ